MRAMKKTSKKSWKKVFFQNVFLSTKIKYIGNNSMRALGRKKHMFFLVMRVDT